MKLSAKFLAACDIYLEWEKCSSPLGEHASRKVKAPWMADCMSKTTAQEALYAFETHGEVFYVHPLELELAQRLFYGKANRDWWTKEIGWWTKHAEFYPEDFLVHLTPETFNQLFRRYPRVDLTRHVYDNTYTDEELDRDLRRWYLGMETERDDVRITR